MMIKTQISAFCTDFSETLLPLSEALADTTRQLEETGESALAPLHSTLANIHHRLEALVNKVQGQEAYVLLFGPLKSGKSTLMNAISASYVSEVTSLPAYPCMVNLRYGPKPSYSIIRYSGKKESLASPQELKALLEQSHRTLSERVRAIEDFGENFDPAVHLPSAIRRVQVELPAENLRDSGTVLVDTPGLYSKMKFGYDAMSREFRDSAASAVFVVKTDNLFLEQVFEDFNDLLDQFSRVFVVVNIDAGKRDLSPDGTLEQSLESRDPAAIVKAFEALTMSAPLRRAGESGRLHIYPVDLCGAAARRLAHPDAEPGPEEDQDDFDVFLRDLFAYLNSTDYLREFMADTMRQSEKLSKNISAQCTGEKAAVFQKALAANREALASLQRTHDAANLLQTQAWAERYSETIRELRENAKNKRGEAVKRFALHTREKVESWMAAESSLEDLRKNCVAQPAAEALETLANELTRKLEALADTPQTGLKLDSAESAALRMLDLRLEKVAAEALRALPPAPTMEAPPLLPLEKIPLRRSLRDKLMFRSVSRLRKKRLGDDTTPLSPRRKEKLLGKNAAESLVNAAVDVLKARMRTLEAAQAQRLGNFPEQMAKALDRRLNHTERALARERADLNQTTSRLENVQSTFERLSREVERALETVSTLSEKHQHAISAPGENDQTESRP